MQAATRNSSADFSVGTPPLGAKDKLVRFLFHRCMKDKNTRKLVRRFWPAMRVTIENMHFDLHPADNTTERKMYMTRELEERESMQVLHDEIHGKTTLVFDIGANCGMYSVYLAQAAGTGSTLHAFEPNPLMADRLEHNIGLNHVQEKTKVHRVALAAERGTATLHLHDKNHGQSSLRSLDNSSKGIEVEQRPLTDYLPELAQYDYFVIKIDVEGREDSVMYPFITSCPEDSLPDAILIEMVLEDHWDHNLRKAFLERNYSIVYEGEGNALFKRHPTSMTGVAPAAAVQTSA